MNFEMKERGAAPDPARPPREGSLVSPVPRRGPGRIPVAMSGSAVAFDIDQVVVGIGLAVIAGAIEC